MFNFNFLKKDNNLSEDAKYVIDIVNKYAADPKIKKIIDTYDYFLIDDENEITVCIGEGKVMISNHVFLYKKTFNLSFTDQLKKIVKDDIKSEVKLLKENLFKNETGLLGNISKLNADTKMPKNITASFT